MRDGKVSSLPGIADFSRRLHEDRAEVILCSYKDTEGGWHYLRYDEGGLGIGLDEIGAMAKMQMWLNEMQGEHEIEGG